MEVIWCIHSFTDEKTIGDASIGSAEWKVTLDERRVVLRFRRGCAESWEL